MFTILLEFIYTEYISPEKTVKDVTLSVECLTYLYASMRVVIAAMQEKPTITANI